MKGICRLPIKGNAENADSVWVRDSGHQRKATWKDWQVSRDLKSERKAWGRKRWKTLRHCTQLVTCREAFNRSQQIEVQNSWMVVRVGRSRHCLFILDQQSEALFYRRHGFMGLSTLMVYAVSILVGGTLCAC